jgi:hypothetical protein
MSCEEVDRDTENRGLLSICSGISIFVHCLLFTTKDLKGPSSIFPYTISFMYRYLSSPKHEKKQKIENPRFKYEYIVHVVSTPHF